MSDTMLAGLKKEKASFNDVKLKSRHQKLEGD